ncbi:hypothetical protein SUGI_1167190 [Cryptomeria japonica]|nr:hypothetical protein SUGI_1167190 [Cryptomeria japonica]
MEAGANSLIPTPTVLCALDDVSCHSGQANDDFIVPLVPTSTKFVTLSLDLSGRVEFCLKKGSFAEKFYG